MCSSSPYTTSTTTTHVSDVYWGTSIGGYLASVNALTVYENILYAYITVEIQPARRVFITYGSDDSLAWWTLTFAVVD